jgi:holo-[acyl-carrier protein] synthase
MPFASDHQRLTVGIDRVEIEAFEAILASSGEGFLNGVYTTDEIQYSAGRVERLAARFCAKEATLKALGTGLRSVALGEVEVIHSPNGQPTISLLGRALDRATQLHIICIAISMTHTKVAAEAIVVALLDAPKDGLNLERRTIDG